jgi:hypothetical protein
MKRLQHLPLNAAVKVNEQVAAAYQVELRKRWVAQDVVRGEENLFPQRFTDGIKAAGVREKLSQSRRRYIGQNGFEVPAGSSRLDGTLINVRGEHLDAGLAAFFGQPFA